MKVSLRENPQGTGIPGGGKNKQVLLMSENRLVCLDQIFVVTSDLRLTRLINFMTHSHSLVGLIHQVWDSRIYKCPGEFF